MRINTKRFLSGKVIFLLAFLFLGMGIVKAQYTNLINFTGDTGLYIGALPFGSLALSGDTLYGMTYEGGINGDGNIFSVQTNGMNYEDLVDFTGDTGSHIGGTPKGSLTLSGDTLYGMTTYGGINGNGTIFSVQTNGTNYKELIDFTSDTGSYIGRYPNGSLTLSGDTLYGMTEEGGVNGVGNIFSVQTNGTNFKDLVDFTGTSGSYIGQTPASSLTLSGDTLYGMTYEGGINGDGNIFSIQTNGANFEDLVDFTGTSGSYIGELPYFSSLTLAGDTLYGMTPYGGVTGDGNIFSVQTNGTNFKDLVDFTGTSGSYLGEYPWGSLTLSGNTLYGMTSDYSGTSYGDGNIFSVQTNGTKYKDLINFTGLSGSYVGINPFGSLTLSGNTLYGMTSENVVNGGGNIFRFTTLSTTISTTHNVTCNGANNGYATVIASGGTRPYTYSWSPNGGSSYISLGLSAGTYTVTVTDISGLTSSDSVTITQPPTALSVSTVILANLHCNGVDSGSAYAIVSGGISPYTYVWQGIGASGSSAAFSGLSAGTYTIYVRDSNNCYTVGSAIITQPPAILVSTTIINAITNCTSEFSGVIAASVTGEFPPFTYYWTDPSHQATDTAIDLGVGNYTVTVTDSTGCTGWASNTLTASNPFSDSATIISNVTCYGGNNGSATIFVSGGYIVTRNYSFEPAVQHFTVPTNIHTISINIGGAQGGDTLRGYGASFQGECIVNPGEELSVAVGQKGGILYRWAGGGGGASWVYDSTIVLSNPSGTTGLFAVAAGGGGQLTDGRPSYDSIIDTVILGNAGGTNLVTNATTTYTNYFDAFAGAGGIGGNGGKASDFGGGEGFGGAAGGGWLSNGDCRIYGSSFGGMDEANHFDTSMGVSAGYGGFGGGGGGGWSSDGAYIEGVSGGGGGYNGGGNVGGGGGSYFINTAPIVTANDTGNGFVTISYTVGGIPPYTYLWSNGETTKTATGLSAGTYSVTVSDSSGCLLTDSVTITQPPAIVPTIAEYSGVKCNGDSNAVLFASASGGSGFYEYQWSNASSQTNSLATGLSVGTYSVTVTDNNGCTGTASVIITQSAPIIITADSINATNGNCNGSAWAIVNGGTNPYSYLWTGGLTTDTILNQCVNYYCCTITDANGCMDSVCVNIETSTGTKQWTIDNGQLTIFPNPNNGFFTIQLSEVSARPDEPFGRGQSSVEIYNVLGEKIFLQLSIVHYPLSIDLSSQPNGIYFYRVIKENGGLVGEGKLVIVK